ncbi:MAG: glycosyltransferase family 4 protein [Microcoleus sp. PH2017_15_JOR_U_A]|uniref:glycosyltransferase family 4 protein n=1 Tax=Microcoleus sp. PH2017_15_JOR_U_A TaxID=2798826 RepID=UPI001D8FA163|nr:glycosyltransferase family 4 protein [Microcoleus sp. PH2017_15_JOR_U_A]MCC3495985.1 glycosyltransferase family 4 protein [Microcoleus sp. PH2017_15_JOR_U_A]
MRITFVLPTLALTGGMRVLSIYTQILQQRGHTICIVSTPHERPTLMQQLRSVVRGKGWEPAQARGPSHFDRIDVESRVTETYRPITDRDVPDADIIMATWWETAEWVSKLSPSKGAKVYFLQHYEAFDYTPKDRVDATWRLPMHKIAVAKWLEDKARDEFGNLSVSLVPPTVDTTQFYDPRSRSGQPRGKQLVPTVGMYYSIAPWKGCALAIEAFNLAAKRIPNLRLVAFGSGETAPPDLLQHNIEYYKIPSQDELKELYSKCDAWLFASQTEGFGLPILEAMACGTPVIGTPAGAAPELLAGGGGILVKPEDPEDMAKAIEQICQLSDAEWRAMSETALDTVIHYTWEDATDIFEAALYTAVERQPQLTDKLYK